MTDNKNHHDFSIFIDGTIVKNNTELDYLKQFIQHYMMVKSHYNTLEVLDFVQLKKINTPSHIERHLRRTKTEQYFNFLIHLN